MTVDRNVEERAAAELCGALDQIADQFRPPLTADEQAELVAERARRDLDSLDSLRRVRALLELTRRLEVQALLRADAEGRTQREIGGALGKPQTQVHRLLRGAKASEIDTHLTVDFSVPATEIILQYKAGAISRGTMIGRLIGARHGHSAGGEHDDGFVPDTWDQVRDAFLAGLLTEAEYEEIRGSLPTERPRS